MTKLKSFWSAGALQAECYETLSLEVRLSLVEFNVQLVMHTNTLRAYMNKLAESHSTVQVCHVCVCVCVCVYVCVYVRRGHI
jgi:hypothetical protein